TKVKNFSKAQRKDGSSDSLQLWGNDAFDEERAFKNRGWVSGMSRTSKFGSPVLRLRRFSHSVNLQWAKQLHKCQTGGLADLLKHGLVSPAERIYAQSIGSFVPIDCANTKD
ncbi:hypothetical protein X801_04333, partial [Opisthorchis viverrini]